jgi:hypothetical protein
MRERRQLPRQRVLKGAIIYFNKESSSVDCIVRNLTAIGARLDLESTHFVPDRFDLLIKQEHQLYPAELVWRGAKNLGIRFTGAPRKLAAQQKPAP